MLCNRKIYMKWFFFYLYAKYFSKIHHVLPNDTLNFCVYMTYFLFFFQHNKRQNETCVLGLLHFYKDLMSAAPVGSHHGGLSASISPYPGFSWWLLAQPPVFLPVPLSPNHPSQEVSLSSCRPSLLRLFLLPQITPDTWLNIYVVHYI